MEYLGLNLTTKEVLWLNKELDKYKYNKKRFSLQSGCLEDKRKQDKLYNTKWDDLTRD